MPSPTGRTGTRQAPNRRSRRTTPRASSPAFVAPSRAAEPEPTWTVPSTGMPTFAELGLPAPVVAELTKRGFTAPFPIQAATWPETLAGRDLLGRGQTGSGKTLAFGLAILSRLAGGHRTPQRPRGLVLVPTRELAQQVDDALAPFATVLGLRTTVVVGGLSFSKQAAELRRGVDLVVATPGRLTDHIQQRTVDLGDIAVTALDEADRMADMGFLPQVRAILDRTPANGQRLLFSATLDGAVGALVNRYLTDPVTRSVAPPTGSVTTMEHHLLFVERDSKPRVVAEIASRDGRTLLFVRTKHGADKLVKILRRDGIVAGALHGGKAQNARTRAIEAFRTGSVPVLVATDVAARGIHVDDVGLVVHVDPPADPKDYLHRAGRTARAGESGVVVTLVTADERRDVDTMTRQAGIRPARVDAVPGGAELVRITGAREPSGVPLAPPTPPAPQRPQRSSRPQRSGGGGARTGGRGRRRAA